MHGGIVWAYTWPVVRCSGSDLEIWGEIGLYGLDIAFCGGVWAFVLGRWQVWGRCAAVVCYVFIT